MLEKIIYFFTCRFDVGHKWNVKNSKNGKPMVRTCEKCWACEDWINKSWRRK